MSCCAPGVEATTELKEHGQQKIENETLVASSIDLKDGRWQVELAVPEVHCAACMRSIETELQKLAMVEAARVNLSTKRVKIFWSATEGVRPNEMVDAINRAGYRALPLDAEDENAKDKTFGQLVRALGVAGFAAMNIMLFSVSIWSGADDATRDLFHWISALIAIPAVAFSGQPFFRSAFQAVRHGRLNMDVPISLAVILALLMSIYETANSGEHAYFDASVTLLFFLLIGRTLDHLMRERARSAVRNLASLAPRGALQRLENGEHQYVKLNQITPGMVLDIAAGERIPVDGIVLEGASDVDLSLVTGESAPEAVAKGAQLLGGATNLSAPITIKALKPAHESFLARMVEMMEAAEGSRAGYKRIADRAAEIYAPAVHLLALFTFIGWGLYDGNWHHAMITAIAVLIITCPCALALAVPIVHVVAAGRLFEHGMMMRDGAALERLAEIDKVVFDKTGTLTEGRPEFVGQIFGAQEALNIAQQLAKFSNHPFSKALAKSRASGEKLSFKNVEEIAGQGIQAKLDGATWRLGRASFCFAEDDQQSGLSQVYLARDNELVATFEFEDQMRQEVPSLIEKLKVLGLELRILSGDRRAAVKRLADLVGVEHFGAGLTPQDKLDALNQLSNNGAKVLMVGDGINDAPALRAAHVSMAPSSAADVGRNAADFVLTRDRLDDIPFALVMAKRASRAVKQNFALALSYNAVAIPLAVLGFSTPLVASIAMSSSSVLVTLNALRLRLDKKSKVVVKLHRNQTEIVAAE